MTKIIRTKVSVGVEHPLYNKEIDVEVLRENAGYDGRQTYVRTVDEVLYENVPLLHFDKNGKFIGEEIQPPFSEKWEGYARI